MIPQDVKERIEKEAQEWALCPGDLHMGYLSGATAEYLRSQEEIKELERKCQTLPDATFFDYETCREANESYRKELQKRDELLAELWSLWESMAECGELSIGPKFSQNYDRLKNEYSRLKHKG